MNFKKIKKNKIISVLSLAIMLNVFAALPIIPANTNCLWAQEKNELNFQDTLKAAEQGDVAAQHNLAVMYAKGNGTKQNYKKAAEWYEKAAEQGFAEAQYNLAFMYDHGKGIKQNYKKAFFWYEKAAEQGIAEA